MRNPGVVLQPFCGDDWQQPQLEKRRSEEGACSEAGSELALEIIMVITGAEWVQEPDPCKSYVDNTFSLGVQREDGCQAK